MALWDGYDDVPFVAVRNQRAEYSVWPTSQPIPRGWQPVGPQGTRDDCLARVERLWVGGWSQHPPAGDGPARQADLPVGRSAAAGPVRDWPAVPIHQLIERADIPATAVALRCGDVTLSRARLFETAHAWARVLAGVGCGPDVPVAVVVPRGVDALTAIFAVLCAGAGYVPLAYDRPVDELLEILDDCGRPLVLAADDDADDLATRLSRPYRGRVLSLRELRARAAGEAAPLAAPVAPSIDSLAYVFYTSGTTGRPKGVEGVHRQLTNYALWCRSEFPHQPGERTVLHAPLSFLGSLTTIFTPLLAGWPIEIAPERSSVDDLLELAGQAQVGLLKLTPTHVRMMLARGAAGRRTARHFMIGSEPLVMTRELSAWLRDQPSATFVNHYGLTETHGCFCHPFRADVPIGDTVPIGLPIANARAHLVDRHGDDVPLGEPGELLVAGPSIARGYRGKPRLTADRWIPDRHGEPGARILRTGDLGRMRPDGVVELLGRVDRQVKVRGHRVEPGAVEHALRAHPDVLECLVLPRRYDDATTLVAYVIPRAGAAIDPATVHRALSDKLALPSVPSRIAVLPEFPTNPNGKTDVSRLPDPPPLQPIDRAAGSEPREDRWTRCDRVVAEAFSLSLGIDSIGLHDDLFELGGDSLMAVRVAQVVGRRLGADVPLPTTSHGTVRAYAHAVATALATPGPH